MENKKQYLVEYCDPHTDEMVIRRFSLLGPAEYFASKQTDVYCVSAWQRIDGAWSEMKIETAYPNPDL